MLCKNPHLIGRIYGEMSEISQNCQKCLKKWTIPRWVDIYDKSRKDKLRHKIWVAKSPPELPAVSTDHETLCSFSIHAQPRRNLVDFECTHNITINEFIHCNILTVTQNMNHTTSQLMKQWLMLSIESRSSRKVYPPCSGFTLPHGGINVYKCIKNGPPCNHNGLLWIHRRILLFTSAE